jgi:predicted ATP-grasp superfamily ATP-dependent carboligase
VSADPLYTIHSEPTAQRPVLIHSFQGFLDAGGAPTLAADHLLATLEHRLVATFDSDSFLDYRARRPRLTFVRDHYANAAIPQINLYEVKDTNGTPFLLLVGPEPDYRWQAFISAVTDLVDQLGVRLVVSLGAIPWPISHTRPAQLTAHATDPAMVSSFTPWVDQIEVPGHVSGLLELHLGETGHSAMGYVVHVPQYLAQFQYPRSAMALLDSVSQATGLSLPSGALEPAAVQADSEITEHLSTSPELAQVVSNLEQQYDAMANGRELLPGPTVTPIPSADEIAAQVEAFLAEQIPGNEDH